jgi:hypothetical protein
LTSSTIMPIEKPCASMIASVQPSRQEASNSSARRRSGLGLRLRRVRVSASKGRSALRRHAAMEH